MKQLPLYDNAAAKPALRLSELLGQTAFVILMSAPTPSGRRNLEGAARARIEAEREADYEVTILATSHGGVRSLIGTKRWVPKQQVYLASDRDRHRAFGEEVRRFWGREAFR